MLASSFEVTTVKVIQGNAGKLIWHCLAWDISWFAYPSVADVVIIARYVLHIVNSL